MGRVKETLQECYNKSKTEGENLMFPLIEAFEAGATMGEITGTMRMAYDYPYDPFGQIESII